MPANTTTPYLLGKHLTAITITPLTVGADGTLTAGLAVDLEAYIAEVDPSEDVEAEDIRPVWSTRPNMVPISEGASLRIACLQRSDAASDLTNTLRPPTLAKRFRIAWTQGTEDFTGEYTFLGWGGGVKVRGANATEARFGPLDNGNATQVTYA